MPYIFIPEAIEAQATNSFNLPKGQARESTLHGNCRGAFINLSPHEISVNTMARVVYPLFAAAEETDQAWRALMQRGAGRRIGHEYELRRKDKGK